MWYFCVLVFFFNDTATTEIYTLSLHDALPISAEAAAVAERRGGARAPPRRPAHRMNRRTGVAWMIPSTHARCQLLRMSWSARRSEEHTSELQSRQYLVCRLLLEKKKQNIHNKT